MPFIQACVSVTGTVRPCCSYDFNHPNPGSLNEDGSISKSLQTDIFKEIRQAQIDGVKHPGCWRCYDREERSGGSARTGYNAEWENDVKELVSNGLSSDTFDIRYIETGFGNLCNLSCKMCQPKSSSTFHKIVIPDQPVERRYFSRIEDWDIDLSNIKHLKLVGGEPMMEPGHIDFLKQLFEQSNPTNISLVYFTNATKKPSEELVEYWKKFKQITLTFSIDACYDIQLFQRPGNYVWSDIEDTIDYYFSLEDTVNLDYEISTTVTPINIMNIGQLIDWTKEKFNHISGHSFNMGIRPDWMILRNLEQSHKDKIIKYLDSLSHYDNNDLKNIIGSVKSNPTGDTFTIDDVLNNYRVKTITSYYNQENLEDKIREQYS